jgi:hypothetical protein
MKKFVMTMVIVLAITATDAQAGWRRGSATTCTNGSCTTTQFLPTTLTPAIQSNSATVSTPTCSNVTATTTSCTANRRRIRGCR